MLHKEGLDEKVCQLLGLTGLSCDLTEWETMVERQLNPIRETTIALVGKYVELPDAYLSIVEALTHGGIAHQAKVHIKWVQSADLTQENVAEALEGCHGILVPGGFGQRGLEGKMMLSSTPVNTRFRSLAFAWGCRWRLSNTPATC